MERGVEVEVEGTVMTVATVMMATVSATGLAEVTMVAEVEGAGVRVRVVEDEVGGEVESILVATKVVAALWATHGWRQCVGRTGGHVRLHAKG